MIGRRVEVGVNLSSVRCGVFDLVRKAGPLRSGATLKSAVPNARQHDEQCKQQ